MRNQLLFLIICLLLQVATSAQAGAPADAGTILRDIEQAKPRGIPTVPVTPTEALPKAEEKKEVSFIVTKFTILGAKSLTDAQIQAEISGHIGQEVTFSKLETIALKVSRFYQSKGYLAKVFLPPQDIVDGVVTIEIVEATLGKVTVNNEGQRLNQAVAENMLKARQQESSSLSYSHLETSMLLINDLPGVSATSNLAQGDATGETDVQLSLRDLPLLSSSIWLDNYGSRFTGSNRANVLLQLDNPSGMGDQVNLYALHSKGSSFVQAGYSMPIGYLGTRLEARVNHLDYALFGGDLDILNAKGKADSLSVELTHPILRQVSQNLRLTTTLESQKLKDYVLGFETSDRKLNSATLGLSGDIADNLGTGGITWAGVSLTGGELDLSGNQSDLEVDKLTTKTDGGYGKLNFYLGRLQGLTDKFTLQGLLSGQLATQNLDSAEKFSLGGPSGLRAFANGEARADQGWMLNLEARYRINTNLSLSLFGDAGGVCINKNKWTDWNAGNPALKNCYTLGDVGLGLNWVSQHFNTSLSYARRVSSNPGLSADGTDVEGQKDQHQVWLQLYTRF